MPAIPHDQPPSTTTTTLPIRKHNFPTPLLRLQLNDLSHEGSSVFLSNIHGNEDLSQQVQNVLNLLYTPTYDRPGTRSVTFILREFSGVAYTTGSDIDSDHKEIHINLGYIKAQAAKTPREEVLGVVCHELVHCFQWAAEGTAPGGLIEGIADWVRLNAGLAAQHWKRDASGKWDGGYQHTGYFLQYLEDRFGHGTVSKVNGCLAKGRYDERKLFSDCCGGKSVDELWADYAKSLKGEEQNGEAANVDHSHSSNTASSLLQQQQSFANA
ncbi:BSP-domain-containing protein [Polychaeton citri CBS 116435]|uniref:BSP-domain-containing protein n=1 Tax=Polychaeton citri CBS 116435 TaxID=1314669 RepID=A0A9P4QBW4_9PEZI|nr:BSP-domain-containing protein [Polychaeton citri CBS 116435]